MTIVHGYRAVWSAMLRRLHPVVSCNPQDVGRRRGGSLSVPRHPKTYPRKLPLPPESWAATPCAAQALIVARRERIRELEARLGLDSANSSCPPSSDPPHAPRKRRLLPSGRQRGGQPGHRGRCRALLSVEQVAEVVVVVPESCGHCGQPLGSPEGLDPAPAVLWRTGRFGSDSAAGRRLAARLLTVVASCRQQERRLLDCLVAAAEAALRGSPPPSLLAAAQGS